MTDTTTPECLTYTAAEAAKILKVSYQTITRAVRKGKLPNVDLGADLIIIPKWAVDRLVAPPEGLEPGVAPGSSTAAGPPPTPGPAAVPPS